MCALYFRGAEMDVRGKTNLPTIACPECGVDTVARDDGVLCLEDRSAVLSVFATALHGCRLP